MRAYVGGYTDPDRDGRGEGIYVFDQDPATGRLTQLQVIGGVRNPSFLALHPNGRFLYATNSGAASGVSSFALRANEVAPLNRQPSMGTNPAHIAIDPTGRYVAIANFTGGTVAMYPLDGNGSLKGACHVVRHEGPRGPHPTRQDVPHPHQCPFDPSGRFLLVNDLGLDRTYVYALDPARGRLMANDPGFASAPSGAGPRHLAFHPDRRSVYILGEIDSTLTAHSWDEARGALTLLQTVSTLPSGFSGNNSTAQVVVHPNGRFVYASNRGHDSIAIFGLGSYGRMTAVGHESTRGKTPRNFNLTPDGSFLYALNQDSDTIVVFRVDGDSGRLSATGDVAAAGSPSCVIFGHG
jgi:6-phosphogluconolactonase (cycloisomerase 2 family)